MNSSISQDDPIPISLVAHAVFCPRRAWLEASGEEVDSVAILAGTRAHKRVDKPIQSTPFVARSVNLSHPELALTGRCDLIEGQDDGSWGLVEYKSTPVRRRAEVTHAQRVQLALQALCLQAMGQRVHSASVYFTNHNQRLNVDLTPALLEESRGWLERTHQIVKSTEAPAPLRDDRRCLGCSHATVCLPDELTHRVPARSISVSDPAAEIVHLTTHGSRASMKSGRLEVIKGAESLISVPLERVAGLVVHGNIDISSALVRELLWQHLTVVWCSTRGRVIGWANTADTPNGLARVRQHSLSELGSLPLASEFVYAKVANQATFLRRNGQRPEAVVEMRKLQNQVRGAFSLPEVFALEGRAAQLYFGSWPTLLKGSGAGYFLEQWPGRQGRSASDPLNVCLNFAYMLLLADALRACVACGLDPHAGFLHSSSRNKPALALDLMEEFRAPVADSSVITAINSTTLRQTDFSTADIGHLDGATTNQLNDAETD